MAGGQGLGSASGAHGELITETTELTIRITATPNAFHVEFGAEDARTFFRTRCAISGQRRGTSTETFRQAIENAAEPIRARCLALARPSCRSEYIDDCNDAALATIFFDALFRGFAGMREEAIELRAEGIACADM